MVILGVLAALGSTGSNNVNWQGNSGNGSEEGLPSIPADGFNFDTLPLEEFDWLWLLPAAALIALIAFFVVLGILVWAVSVIARGGLIAGANSAEEGEAMTFGQAWGAAWSTGWRLLGISLIPAIPMLIFLAVGIAAFAFTVGFAALNAENIGAILGAGFLSLFLCLFCLLMPIWVVLEVLRIFAMRACVLGDVGVFDAYRRGVEVLRANSTEFIVLLLLRVAVGIVIAIVLFLPGIVMTICCILWPLLLLIKGAIAAYFSTMWTLAWREWTGAPPAPQLPDAPDAA